MQIVNLMLVVELSVIVGGSTHKQPVRPDVLCFVFHLRTHKSRTHSRALFQMIQLQAAECSDITNDQFGI